MALTVKSLYSCHEHKSSTNKGKNSNKISLNIDDVAISYKELGIVIMKPVIDRFMMSFYPKVELIKQYDPGETLETYKAKVHNDICTDADHVPGMTFVKLPEAKQAQFKGYAVNVRFKPTPDSDEVLVQVSPFSNGWPFLKIDCNPSRITPQGRLILRQTLMGWLAFGTLTEEELAEQIFIYSKIKRLDVAVDVLGVQPSDLEVMKLVANLPVAAKKSLYKSATGRTETIYPDFKPGKSSSMYFYDKRKKELEIGAEPIYGEFLHTRFECRMPSVNLFKASKAANRCKRVSMRALNVNGLNKQSMEHRLFTRLALATTYEKALEMVPEKQVEKFASKHQSVMNKAWDPDKIWSYWPETLKRSMLFPLDTTYQ